jgi:hypothetical protein
VKIEALDKNEKLWSMHKRLFNALNIVLVIEYECLKFDSQVKDTHENYKKSLEAYDTIAEWKEFPPTFMSSETLSFYFDKQII